MSTKLRKRPRKRPRILFRAKVDKPMVDSGQLWVNEDLKNVNKKLEDKSSGVIVSSPQKDGDEAFEEILAVLYDEEFRDAGQRKLFSARQKYRYDLRVNAQRENYHGETRDDV